MRITIAKKQILDKILARKRRDEFRPEDIDLKGMFKEILAWANKFVPSESGSILLDDPSLTPEKHKTGVLYFVACFGKGSTSIIETPLPIELGIAGKTYKTGRPYISRKVEHDDNFYPDIDKKTKFVTRSIICAPIRIKTTTIGVIELINRLDGTDYNHNDLTLLKIFAEYTSTLIQNSLDAKRFGELSMRDNLTGLYNDRYFYLSLTKEVMRALKKDSELSLLFLDLDRFKEINDTHGHLAGSGVLAEVGGIISDSITGSCVAARYGGDEFIVILPGYGAKEAVSYAEELRKTIEDFVFLKHKQTGGEKALRIKGVITSSSGIASLRHNIESGGGHKEVRDTLIKLADGAMYKSKQAGKNRVLLADEKVCPMPHPDILK